ncbi:hypothetical protein NN561_015864 [Cricetulus griseus]
MHSAPLVTSLPGLARPATPPRAPRRPGLDPGPVRGPGRQPLQPRLRPGLAARPVPRHRSARGSSGSQAAGRRLSSARPSLCLQRAPTVCLAPRRSLVHKDGGQYRCCHRGSFAPQSVQNSLRLKPAFKHKPCSSHCPPQEQPLQLNSPGPVGSSQLASKSDLALFVECVSYLL